MGGTGQNEGKGLALYTNAGSTDVHPCPIGLNVVERVGLPIVHVDLRHLEILREFFSQYFPGEGSASSVMLNP